MLYVLGFLLHHFMSLSRLLRYVWSCCIALVFGCEFSLLLLWLFLFIFEVFLMV